MNKSLSFFILLFFAFTLLRIQAQNWAQVGNPLNGDAAFNQFGFSVSISSDGSVIAVGAPEAGGLGSFIGYVRVYKNINGVWTRQGNDIKGKTGGDELGVSISLNSDGSVVAVGAPGNDGAGRNAGHVRVFKYQSNEWVQLGNDINGIEVDYETGGAVSLNADGTVLATGAYNDRITCRGAVRVFHLKNGLWAEDNIDYAYGRSDYENYGASVSLNDSGDVLAVGAPGYDASGINNAGKVEVFYYNKYGTWQRLGGDIIGKEAHDGLGVSVSMSNATSLVVGCRRQVPFENSVGAARIYKYINGLWTQMGDDIEGESSESFSTSVSINNAGDIVAVGGCLEPSRIYKYQNGIWNQIGAEIESFGYSGFSIGLSGDGNVVVLGAIRNKTNGEEAGQARVYKFENTSTNINDIPLQGIKFFPNPANEELFVELDDVKDKTLVNKSICIIDITGRVVREITPVKPKLRIDVSNFAPGVYLIKAGGVSRKLVIN